MLKHLYGTGQWFEYIPESDNHLVIATETGAAASSTILLYEKEDMLLVASDSSEYDYGHICELNHKVKKDVSYLIYIGNYSNSTLDGFNWDLREGFQSCDIDLTMMEQFVPYNLSGNTEYWFEFEAPYNCEAIINASDIPGGANVDIQIFSDCDSPLTNLERGTASALVGEKSKILIKCRGEKVSGSYKVELSLVNKPLGSYEFPLEAVKGENTVQPGITWFYYVSDSDCKVELTELAGEGGITKFDVYRYRNGNIYRSTTSNTFRKAAYRSDANKRVLIKIEYNGLQEGINWLLEEKDFEEGDVISLTLKAEEGINLEDKCNRMPSFYYYVPEQDGELTVSTCELTSENTSFYVLDSINQVSTALFNDNYCGLQSQLSFNVIENDTIYIVWYEDNTNVPYEWKIENNVFGLGEHRKEPKEAIVGLNESDFTESKDQWFTYKATVNGRIRLSSCEVEATFLPDIKVYESNGGEVRISKSTSCGWNKYEALFECVEGVSYDMQFDVYSIDPDRKQNWILEEIAYEPGEKCYYPKEAFEGINNAISRKTKWFSYTATDNCELSISRCGIDGQENYGYSLNIYLNCDQRTYRYDYKSCDIGRKYTLHAHKDSTYLFNWIGTDLSALEWNLDVSIYEESGFCEDAKVANEGINKIEFNSGHTWYFFKPDRDGRLHLDSRGFSDQDTYLIFYDGCSDGLTNTRISESDSYYGDEAYISRDVMGGQTYYICWRGDEITDDYEWELRFDPKGDSKELPLSVEIGANHRVASEINQQYYDLSLHSGQSGLYEISLPQSANAKIEVLDNNPHPYMFNYNDDSTKLDINNSWALSYKLKITSDSGDAFDWLLEQKHMDTIRVEDETSVHSDFFMDWFKLKDPIDGYVMLESDKPISAADDITLLNSYNVILPFKSPEQSAVFKINENWDYTLNWKNSLSANDYYWGFKSIEFDTNTKCFDGYKAKEGINKLKIDARSYWYKLSVVEDGNYLIKGKLPDGYDIDIYNLSMYEGDCNGWGINNWYTEDMFVAEQDSFILRIDSLKSANYYLNWNFKVGEDQIVPFEWELKMTEAIRIGINDNFKNDRAAYVDNNPNRGIFNVHVDESYLNGIVSLYNLSGAIINRKEIINTCIPFDESELPSGIYLLIVRNGDKESSLKVVIR